MAALFPQMTNPRGDRTKAVKALAQRSVRRRAGLWLVEGPQSVREAVRHCPDRVKDVYLSDSAAARYTEIVAEAEQHGVRLTIGTTEVLDAMSLDAQGVVAVVQEPVLPADDAAALSDAMQAATLVVVLSHVRDPGNAGTVIRAADAAGADLVILTEESVEIGSPKVLRSTAGSMFHLPVLTGYALSEVVDAAQAAGRVVFAADGSGDVDLGDLSQGNEPSGLSLGGPTVWVFGNEAWGLSVEERALADAVIRVPIYGQAESLNLATAATVCLYASAFAHR